MPEQTQINSPLDSTKNTKEEVPTDKTKIHKESKIIIYAVLIAILVVFLGILAYVNLVSGRHQEKEKAATTSASKSGKVDIEEVAPANKAEEKEQPKVISYCENGLVYENKNQGYKVCLIKGWYKSEFTPDSSSVGFDSNPIPEASEYGGLIVVNVSNKTSGEVMTEVSNNLDGETSSNVTVDGVAGTKVIGSLPADNVYYPGYKEVVTIFGKFNRTYEVTMITDPARLATNEPVYNDFLTGWRFLTSAASPP